MRCVGTENPSTALRSPPLRRQGRSFAPTPTTPLAPPNRFAHRAPMRNPLRTLLIVLAVIVIAIVVLQFLPNERAVGPIEQDVTNDLVGG